MTVDGLRQALRNPSLQATLRALAETSGRPLPQLRRRAASDLKEMQSHRRAPALWGFAALSRFVRQRGYDPEIVYDLDELGRLRAVGRERSVVYLVTHKTYLDFFVLFDFLYRAGLPTPYIFGGINMNFAGFGALARRAGGIFIRRSFREDPVYKAVLQAYLETLIGRGASFMWAIEGTRSRTGKLLVPRLGLLHYVVRAARSVGEASVSYLPVSVVYDQVPDAIDLAAQESGADKKPESLSWFFHYLKGMGGPFGNIYVRLDDPLSLTDTPDAPDLDVDGVDGDEEHVEIQKLAFEICYRINEMTPATLTSLVLLVLLSIRQGDAETIARDVELLQDYIHRTDRRARMRRPSRSLSDEPREGIELLLANGLLRRVGGGEADRYEIAPDRLVEAQYYGNMSAHHFVVSALVETALALSRAPIAIGPECRRLRNLLKFEFFFSRSEVFDRQIEHELEEIDPDWADALSPEGPGSDALLRRKPLLVAPGILRPIVRAYRLVAEAVLGQGGDACPSDEQVIRSCMDANRSRVAGAVGKPLPAVSRALLQNGLRLLGNQGLKDGDSRDLADRRAVFLAELDRIERGLSRLPVVPSPY